MTLMNTINTDNLLNHNDQRHLRSIFGCLVECGGLFLASYLTV